MSLLFSLFLSIAFARTTGPKAITNDEGKHPTSNAVDGSLATSFATQKTDDVWLGLTLSKKTDIQTLSIWPGDMSKGERSYREKSRPKLIRIFVDEQQVGEPRRIQDQFKRFDFKVNTTGRNIKIVVDEFYNGVVFSDVYIAEISVNFSDRSTASRYDKWLSSKTAQRALKKHEEKVKEKFEAIKTSEFGDKDAFSFLCTAAADGAKYQRKMLPTYVPEGYRIQAQDASPLARKALRKLEDANAVSCLQQAALRVGGKKSFKRLSNVQRLNAIGELKGGPNYSVGAWGGSGWSKGELQGFGEPLPLEVDPYGMVWVADTGNNRIQLFNENGRSKKIFGEDKPSVVDNWFDKGRPWYVSGSPAQAKANAFINPVDLVMIPQKKDLFSFATLDANGRIQLFNEKGEPILSWKAEHSFPAKPQNGGTAYLTYLKKKKALCAIIQDSGACYKLDSEQLSKFDIEDGVPTSVESLPNGKMLFSYSDKVVLYSFDGFRHKVVMDREILGNSFEMMDMTLDEKNKLWILTDYGDLFKFKRPGKVDFKIRITDIPLRNPRIAVQDDMLYLLFEDKIRVFDIKQALVDEEEAKKEKSE